MIRYDPDVRWTFERVWRIGDAPILFEARQPFAPMSLTEESHRLH